MINNIRLLRSVKYKQCFFMFSPINAGNRGGLQQFSIIQLAMFGNQSQMNSKNQSSTYFGGKDQISSQFEDLLRILKTHSNPFLVRDVKDFLLTITPGIREYEIPKYFHHQIKNKIEAFFNVLQNPEEQRDRIKVLYQKISTLPEPPSKLWEAANLLMNTPTIKSLSVSFAEELMQLLLAGNQTKLNDFFDKRYNKKDLSKEKLESDLKFIKLDNKPIKNLSTLISQIFKRKPKQTLSQETPNSRASEFLEKLQNLNKQKTDLIVKMNREYHAIFQLHLRSIIEHNKTMSNQELCHHLTELKKDTSKVSEFQKHVDTVKLLQKELGTEVDQNTIIMDVLTLANYMQLCQKSQSLSTVNIVRNLSKAEQFSQAMVNKDMIAFFGMTGAGKSTSVNYLLGIPLLNSTNHLNQKVVKIDNSFHSQGNTTPAKIGESINISETIFSQGYKIVLQESPGQFKDVILCDNPGFGDTRGSEMIICTNMSIDESVEKCRSIKAIVLVIPFDCFKLDRGNSLVQLISLMQQRFPEVLKEGSSTNECFHILVTKWNNCPEQIEKIGEFLKTFIEEQNQKNKKNLGTKSESSTLNDRRFKILIFQALAHLHRQGRVRFIDIEDSFERQEILEKYLSSKVSVNKSKYVKAMECRSMQETFSKQISSLAHTWSENIINNYFVKIPSEIQEQRDNIQTTKKEIVQKSQNIALQEGNLKDKMKYYDDLQSTTLPNAIKQYERVKKQEFTESELSEMQNQDKQRIQEKISKIPKLEQGSQLKITRYQVDTQNKLKIIEQEQESKKQSEEEKIKQGDIKTQLETQISNISSQILELQSGTVTINIVLRQYQLGQILQLYGTFSYEQRMSYMNRGESTSSSQFCRSLRIGYEKSNFCAVVSIDKQFVLFPHSQFDPKGYISKSQFYQTSGDVYQTKIDFRNVTLQGANLDYTGKKITMSMLFHSGDSQTSDSVPYIKIDHLIPKHIYNQGLIRDKQSQKTVLEQKVKGLQSIISYKQADIQKYNNQINTQKEAIRNNIDSIAEQRRINKQRVETETQRLRAEDKQEKIALFKKQKQQVVQDKQSEIKKVKGEIDNLIKEIENGKRYLQELERKKIYQQGLIQEKLFLLKRYQYLIKDQVGKKVPQSMQKFVKRAYTLNAYISTDKKSSKDAATLAQGYLANFIRFSEVYSEYQQDMAAL